MKPSPDGPTLAALPASKQKHQNCVYISKHAAKNSKGNCLTEVIDADLHLKAVCSFAVRTRHHAGVVDEDVESGLSCRRTERTRCGFNRLVCRDLWWTDWFNLG